MYVLSYLMSSFLSLVMMFLKMLQRKMYQEFNLVIITLRHFLAGGQYGVPWFLFFFDSKLDTVSHSCAEF